MTPEAKQVVEIADTVDVALREMFDTIRGVMDAYDILPEDMKEYINRIDLEAS